MGQFIPPFAILKTKSREVLTMKMWYFSLSEYMCNLSDEMGSDPLFGGHIGPSFWAGDPPTE